MGVEVDGRTVMAMSVYPPESIALWQRYSTEAVAQALRKYSEMVYPYPYPVAWSAWGAEGGMEYPMISFQTSRDIDEKGTYPERHRRYVIGVIIHEVGHNWFPMIINNDERQWMWMDEGLNSFVDHLAGSEFDPVVQRGNMRSEREVIKTMTRRDDPIIMTAADNMTMSGYQAYSKPTLGLVVLREGILGRNCLISHSRSTPGGGPSSAPPRQIFSVPWKMPVAWIWTGSGGVGFLATTTWTCPSRV